MSDDDNTIQSDRRSDSADTYAGKERRKLTCGVLYNCYGAIGEVEDWLDDYCEGDFNLVIEGMDDDLVKKSLKIMFELETDKSRFIEDYAKKN